MAAPEAPVVTQEIPTEPVVSPDPVPSPVEGDSQDPAEGNGLAGIPRADTPDEIEAFLANALPEAREAYERKIESRGEQRAQTRKRETEKATTARLSAWKPYVDNLPVAQNYVNAQLAKLKAGDVLDNPVLFEQATQQLNVGTLGKVVLENEAYVPELLNKYLPEMTEEEHAALEQPLYKFGQTGMAKEAVNAIFETAVQRAKAEAFAEGVKKGEGNLAAKESLLEKLKKTQTIKKESAGVTPNGRAAAPGEHRTALMRKIDEIDPRDPQATIKLEALRKELKRL